MNIYERYGVKPIINLAGAMTRYGGAIVGHEVLDAMDQAAQYSVPLDQLQAAASRVISAKTHAEAGIVTCGASHALTLATAACICGWNVARMNRLPFTDDMPNEVIMPLHHVSGYDHAIQAAGARIILAGVFNDTPDPFRVRPTDRWELESCITEHTAAVACAPVPGSRPPIEDIIGLAHAHSLPVIVDASPGVPPLANLYRYVDFGADLVTVSGGKGLRGPQASAILCGRRDLIGSALLQMLDLAGERFDAWNPPQDLIPKDRLLGKPLHGIGRSGKVTREAIIGLLVALDSMSEQGFDQLCTARLELVRVIEARLVGIAGVQTTLQIAREHYPRLQIAVDAGVAGISAGDAARLLRSGEPGIYLEDSDAERGVLYVDSLNLQDLRTAELAAQSLASAFARR